MVVLPVLGATGSHQAGAQEEDCFLEGHETRRVFIEVKRHLLHGFGRFFSAKDGFDLTKQKQGTSDKC